MAINQLSDNDLRAYEPRILPVFVERAKPAKVGSIIRNGGHEWIVCAAAGRQEARGQARDTTMATTAKCGWVCDGNARDLAGEEARECIALREGRQDASTTRQRPLRSTSQKYFAVALQRQCECQSRESARKPCSHKAEHADDYQDRR